MEIIYSSPDTIEKDSVAMLHFPLDEVLRTEDEMKQRRADAERGMLLGNLYKSKVIIIFKDGETVKQVETTIWALTDKRIILKTGMGIPLHRIIKIKA
ncbi:MAG TPA: hypothetical protein VK783_14575 [Bacteroidia bacterium]|jgi:hypothetical protein|nr:hypothetical protein [Bacteroidia bacterium]